MTTVVQTTYPQPSGYPPQQQPGYPQTGYPPPQPAVIQMPPTQTVATSPPGRSVKYNKKAGLITGILQICAGGLLVIFGVVLLVLGTWYRSGWNIWGGICFYVVTGILGVVSRNQNKCVIIAYMVMCIIAAVGAAGQVIYDSVAASNSHWIFCYYYDYYYNCSLGKTITAVHSLAALTGFAEMVIAIVASAYCCCGVCSGSTPSQRTVVTYSQAAPSGQVTVLAAGSFPPPGSYMQAQNPVLIPGQPPAYTMQQQQQMDQQLPQQPPVPQHPSVAYEEPK